MKSIIKIQFICTLLFILYTSIATAQNGVGINTVSPQAALDVTSTSSGILIPRMTSAQRVAISSPPTASLVYQTDGVTGFYYYNGSAWLPLLNNTTGWNTTGNAGTTAGTNFIGTTDAQGFAINTNGTEKVRVLTNGNVGIGTTAPISKIDVASGNVRIVGNDGYNATGEQARLLLGDMTSDVDARAGILAEFDYGLKFGVSKVGGGGSFGTNSLDAMVIKQESGNVGIGNINPQAVLDLGSGTNGRSIAWSGAGTNWYSTIGTSYSSGSLNMLSGLKLNTTADQYLVSYTGTFSASGIRLNYTAGPDGDIYFFNRGAVAVTAGDVFDYVNNTKLIIKGSGNIGMGTINPSKPLHVYSTQPTTGTGTWYTGSSNNTTLVRIENNFSDGGAGVGASDFIPLLIRTNLTAGSTEARTGIQLENGLSTGVRLLAGLENNVTGASSLILKTYGSGAFNEVMRINSSGSVGIGTTAPTGDLEISKANPITYLTSTGNSNAKMKLYQGFNSYITATNGLYLGTNATDGNAVTILPNTNVGLGTATPAEKLEVYNGNIRLDGTTNRDASIYFRNLGTTGLGQIMSDNILTFSTSTTPTERMRITSTGNVGIGTTNPSYKLQVTGAANSNPSIAIGTLNANTGTATLQFLGGTGGSNNGFATVYNKTATTDRLSFVDGGLIEVMSLLNGGNVGIGTTTPNVPLQVHSTNAATYLHVTNSTTGSATNDGLELSANNDNGSNVWNYENGYLRFATNNSEKVRIDASGNVGIGTTGPIAKLHVNGDLATANGQVKRDFLTWNTATGGSTPIHIKTNIPIQSGVMYRIKIEGYNYGQGQVINSDCVGYTYSGWSCTGNVQNIDYAPGVSTSQYCSSDGYVVIKLTVSSTYYIGFAVSAWFVNPTGGSFNISAAVYHQSSDL